MTKKLRRRNQKTTGYQTPETLNTHEEGRNNKIWLSRLSIREQTQHSIGERQGHQERTALVEKKIVAGSHHHYLQKSLQQRKCREQVCLKEIHPQGPHIIRSNPTLTTHNKPDTFDVTSCKQTPPATHTNNYVTRHTNLHLQPTHTLLLKRCGPQSWLYVITCIF